MNQYFNKFSRICLLSLLLCFSHTHKLLFAENSLVGHANFYHPAHGNYIELYLRIPAYRVLFNYESAAYFCQLKLSYKLLNADKEVLKSKMYEMEDSTESASFAFDIIELRHILLPEQAVYIEVDVYDLYDSALVLNYFEPLGKLQFNEKSVSVSDMIFSDTVIFSDSAKLFSRGKRLFYPNPDFSLDLNASNGYYYFEVYQIADSARFLYCLLELYSADNRRVSGYERQFKLGDAELIPVLADLPLKNLEEGIYYLNLSIRNQRNISKYEQAFYFQLEKIDGLKAYLAYTGMDAAHDTFPYYYNSEQLNSFFGYMTYILDSETYKSFVYAEQASDSVKAAELFYNFWYHQSPEDPHAAWLNYYRKVIAVNQAFGSPVSEGYRSDRGRIYLSYGPPDEIRPYTDEPEALPYEIWHYSKIKMHSNIAFIFYNPTFVQNEYELLHADLPGEIRNNRWRNEIYRRTTSPGSDFDYSPNNYGNQLERLLRR